MTEPISENLRDLEIVPLGAACRVLRCDVRKLKRALADRGLPLVQIGPRRRGVLLIHLDLLIASALQPINLAERDKLNV
jgi:hypothetical protein